MITEDLLMEFGAKKICHNKGDQLFRKGDTAQNEY